MGAKTKHTYKSCLKDAKECKTIKGYYEKHKHSYEAACRNGWIELIIKDANLKRQRIEKNKIYSIEELVSDAIKYKSIGEWIRKNNSKWLYAKKVGIFDIIKRKCFRKVEYTKKECMNDAKNHKNINDWKTNGETFSYSKRQGWLDEIIEYVGFEKQKFEKKWWFKHFD